MSSSVDTIRSAFEHQTIQPYTGEPDYEAIKSVHDQLKANAAFIPSELGGGKHGLLGLIMSDATYLLVANSSFLFPPNPGLLPTIPTGSTAADTYEMVRQHKVNLTTYREVHNTDRALKQIIIETFDDIYTDDLRDPNIGFTGTTAMALLTHLYDLFGNITAADLAKNDENMVTPYDSSTPITKLFSQIEEAVAYAEAGQTPFTQQQILQKAYLLILKTGIYSDDCRSWKRRPQSEHTWANFKPHFTLAYTYLRESQLATGESMFHGANATIHQGYSEAINTLATNATEQHTLVANVVQTNTTLLDQVKALQTQLTALTAAGNNRGNNGGGSGRNDHGTRRINNDESYYHTHGRTRNPAHTSPSCTRKSSNHKDTATLHNQLGGSTR